TRSPRAPAYRRGVLPALRTTGRLCGRLHACHVSAMDEITKPSSLWKRLKGLFGAERTATEDSSEQSVDRESARTLSDASVGPLDDDSPIKTAAQDRFGIDAFAGIVARALAGQGPAEGTVVALHGPWGAGKSSAVNLVLNHLRLLGSNEIEVIKFNPWWFSGSDQLARAFLGEIATSMGRSIRDDGVDALKGIAARLTKLDT